MKPPSGKPIPGTTNLEDVDRQLYFARKYLLKGGSRVEIEDHINIWLDYRLELEPARELVEV